MLGQYTAKHYIAIHLSTDLSGKAQLLAEGVVIKPVRAVRFIEDLSALDNLKLTNIKIIIEMEKIMIGSQILGILLLKANR